MRFALQNGKKVHIKDAVKGSLGQDCWFKNYTLKACKGDYLQYWRYVDDCPVLPKGYENETEWHIVWKSLVKDEYCEVISGFNNEHRADIKTPEYVIELQYSSISLTDAIERTEFYNALTGTRVIWIVNCYGASRKKHLEIGTKKDKNQWELYWKYPKKWAIDILRKNNTKVYLDISPNKNTMLRIWLHEGKLFCSWKNKQTFYNKYLKAYSDNAVDINTVFANLNIKDYD
ncbi:MAG: hypothetical protein J1G05_02140 [Clostridiales bacterium]|nr:hypothetical protein [Clostridiales bacterium]